MRRAGGLHLRYSYIRLAGPGVPGAPHCTRPQYAHDGHHACRTSLPWGPLHWWCSPVFLPVRAGTWPRWTSWGPGWSYSEGIRRKKWTGERQLPQTLLCMILSEAKTRQPSLEAKPRYWGGFWNFFFPPKCNLQIENSKSYLKNMFLVKAICGEAFSNEILTLHSWPSRKAQCNKRRK